MTVGGERPGRRKMTYRKWLTGRGKWPLVPLENYTRSAGAHLASTREEWKGDDENVKK